MRPGLNKYRLAAWAVNDFIVRPLQRRFRKFRPRQFAIGLGAGGAAYFNRPVKMLTPRYGNPSRVDPGTYENRKKRTRGGLFGVVNDPNRGAYNQRNTVSSTCGKKLSKEERTRKMLAAKQQTFVDRWQGIGSTLWDPSTNSGAPGRYVLHYFEAGAADLPVYYFDLTGAFVNVATTLTGATGSYQACPMLKLQRTAGGLFNFLSAPGRNADNTVNAYNWQIEQSPYSSNVGNAGDKSFLSWMDIRMNLFGATKCPVTCNVSLIQFDEEMFCPPAVANIGGGAPNFMEDRPSAADPPDIKRWNDFYLSEVDNLIGPRIGHKSNRKENAYKTLFTRRFEFEPTMTTEGDATPHQVEFFLKYYMDKVVTYERYPFSGDQTTNTELISADDWVTTSGLETTTYLHPKGRVFLKISGDTPVNIDTKRVQVPGSDPAAYTYPSGAWASSFDLMVRRKHLILKSYT